MMVKVYYDDAVAKDALEGKTIAVVGYKIYVTRVIKS